MKDNFIKISGKVLQGERLGRRLGFSTANLDRENYVRRKLKIKLGVYSGLAELSSGRKFKAGIVIGPIDKTGLPKIEAHLIGFKGNLYGKKLAVILKKYLRPFRKYKSVEKLKAQIAKDIERVKIYG